jgi:hypothetical protein
MDETLKEMEKELASLKQELIDIATAIKFCKTKDEREDLFEDKKIIQWDIDEVTAEIANYKELMAQIESEKSPEDDGIETVETEEA